MQTLKHTCTTHQLPGSPSCQLLGPRTMHHAWGCGGRSPLPTGLLPEPTCRQHTGNTKHSKTVSRYYYGCCHLLFTIAQWFPTSGDTVPGGAFGRVWRHFSLSHLQRAVLPGGSVEAMGAAKHRTLQKITAPHAHNQNYPAQNVSSAKAEKSCRSEFVLFKIIHLFIDHGGGGGCGRGKRPVPATQVSTTRWH